MDKDAGDNNQSQKKRARRSKSEIENSLFEATGRIIERVGFPGLTVTELLAEAKIDPPVFYNRYEDIDDLIERYVKNYDYWLRETIEVTSIEDDPVEAMSTILNELIDSLIGNIPMQKLIAWEMNESNRITRRTAQARDLTSSLVIYHFTDALKNCSVKYDHTLSLIIGGLYYLIIHRNLGTFNFIDFSRKESIDNLKENLSVILRKLFDDYVPSSNSKPQAKDHSMEDVARELIKNNVDYKIIKKATKLSDTKLKALYP